LSYGVFRAGVDTRHAIERGQNVLRRVWTFLDCSGAGIGFALGLAHAQTEAGEQGEIRRRPMIASHRLRVNARLPVAFAPGTTATS
jgi:hypothetical protein